ncbi:MAG: hypothetical protein Q4D51_02350 [Eubacteriales bacterium]|nr:hypothetical protein [Eubacteriales bacterium]
MEQMMYTNYNQGDIYLAYRIMRKRAVMTMGIIAVLSLLLFPLIGGTEKDAWMNLFYGINRIYLLLIAAFWSVFVVELYRYITKWDKRKIQQQLRRLGIDRYTFEQKMDTGRFFFPKGKTDSIFVSKDYSIIGGHGRYAVVRTIDILKLGVDTVNRGQVVEHRMHCLMRNGKVYSLNLPEVYANEVAKYLMEIL